MADRLRDLIVKARLVTEAQVREAEKMGLEHNATVAHVLVRGGVIDTQKLAIFLSKKLNLEYAALADREISPRVLEQIPFAVAQRLRAIPVALRKTKKGEQIVIAMSDPTDASAKREIEHVVKKGVFVLVADEVALQRSINRWYGRTPSPGAIPAATPVVGSPAVASEPAPNPALANPALANSALANPALANPALANPAHAHANPAQANPVANEPVPNPAPWANASSTGVEPISVPWGEPVATPEVTTPPPGFFSGANDADVVVGAEVGPPAFLTESTLDVAQMYEGQRRAAPRSSPLDEITLAPQPPVALDSDPGTPNLRSTKSPAAPGGLALGAQDAAEFLTSNTEEHLAVYKAATPGSLGEMSQDEDTAWLRQRLRGDERAKQENALAALAPPAAQPSSPVTPPQRQTPEELEPSAAASSSSRSTGTVPPSDFLSDSGHGTSETTPSPRVSQAPTTREVGGPPRPRKGRPLSAQAFDRASVGRAAPSPSAPTATIPMVPHQLAGVVPAASGIPTPASPPSDEATPPSNQSPPFALHLADPTRADEGFRGATDEISLPDEIGAAFDDQTIPVSALPVDSAGLTNADVSLGPKASDEEMPLVTDESPATPNMSDPPLTASPPADDSLDDGPTTVTDFGKARRKEKVRARQSLDDRTKVTQFDGISDPPEESSEQDEPSMVVELDAIQPRKGRKRRSKPHATVVQTVDVNSARRPQDDDAGPTEPRKLGGAQDSTVVVDVKPDPPPKRSVPAEEAKTRIVYVDTPHSEEPEATSGRSNEDEATRVVTVSHASSVSSIPSAPSPEPPSEKSEAGDGDDIMMMDDDDIMMVDDGDVMALESGDAAGEPASNDEAAPEPIVVPAGDPTRVTSVSDVQPEQTFVVKTPEPQTQLDLSVDAATICIVSDDDHLRFVLERALEEHVSSLFLEESLSGATKLSKRVDLDVIVLIDPENDLRINEKLDAIVVERGRPHLLVLADERFTRRIHRAHLRLRRPGDDRDLPSEIAAGINCVLEDAALG